MSYLLKQGKTRKQGKKEEKRETREGKEKKREKIVIVYSSIAPLLSSPLLSSLLLLVIITSNHKYHQFLGVKECKKAGGRGEMEIQTQTQILQVFFFWLGRMLSRKQRKEEM